MSFDGSASVVVMVPSPSASIEAPISRKSSHASRGNGSPFGNFSGRLKTSAVRGSSGVQGPSSTSGPYVLPLRLPAGPGSPKKNRCGAPEAGLMRNSKSAKFTGSLNGLAICATNTTAGQVAGLAGSYTTKCSPAPFAVQLGSAYGSLAFSEQLSGSGQPGSALPPGGPSTASSSA